MATGSRRSAKNIRGTRPKAARIVVVAEAVGRAIRGSGSWVIAQFVAGLAAYGAAICYQDLAAFDGPDLAEGIAERDVSSEEELVWTIDYFGDAGIGETPVFPQAAYELIPLQISASTLRRRA